MYEPVVLVLTKSFSQQYSLCDDLIRIVEHTNPSVNYSQKQKEIPREILVFLKIYYGKKSKLTNISRSVLNTEHLAFSAYAKNIWIIGIQEESRAFYTKFHFILYDGSQVKKACYINVPGHDIEWAAFSDFITEGKCTFCIEHDMQK